MQGIQKKQLGISVQVVERPAIAAPMVRVLADDVSVGVLKDTQPQVFPVTLGRHRVKVRRDFFRSQVLEFELSRREPVEFGCGFHQLPLPWSLSAAGKAVEFAVTIASALALRALNLPIWSFFVLVGFLLLAVAIDWWRCFIPRGACLYIRRLNRTEQLTPLPEG
jgi:hypothetical protein